MTAHPQLKNLIRGFIFSALLLGLTTVLYTIPFRHAASGAVQPLDIKIPAIDDRIPVIPVLFFGYIWSYVYWFFAPFFILKTDKKHIREFSFTFAATLIACSLICYFVPTAIDRVAEGLWDPSRTDLGWRLLKLCYNFDGREMGYCLLPSMHCANCMTYYQGMCSEQIPVKFRRAALFSTILVAVSALCIKQHYIVDVAAGFLIPIVIHAIVVRVSK